MTTIGTLVMFLSFIAFTGFVAIFSWYKLRKETLNSRDGYFLGGRSLTGSSYVNGLIIIAWEVTSALALVAAAMYFVPRYLRMGLTTIPEYLEYRFDGFTRTMVAFFLTISYIVTLLPAPSTWRAFLVFPNCSV